MVERAVAITDIIFDCSDPAGLALFWATLLGRTIEDEKGPYVWLSRAAGDIGVGFQKVAEPKTGKNRVHIDIAVDDPGASTTRIESLGGGRIEGYERGGFLVMADPEGNEFCLVPLAPFHFDETGHADYLDDT